MKRIAVVALFFASFLTVIPTNADEGMWLLNNLPKDYLKNIYNFDVTDEWVRHVQLSSARLPNCSSSFVSPDGLVFTNGHCAEEAVQALSTPQNNLYEKGFYAPTYVQELKTDRTLKVLFSMTDVTQRINEAVANDKTGNSAQARQKVITEIQVAEIQRNSSIVSNLHLMCEIVVLYQGGQYHNYCYKIYNDVRLVFASEKNVWFMGGDADNFEYPRYTMDVAFFRAYENGKPAKTTEYFKWSKAGAKEGELIFVSGHPGSTKRLLTSRALATERDIRVPFLLDLFRRREMTLQQFMLRGKEQRRIAQSDLFSWQNSRKLFVGKIRGLQDPKLAQSKEDSEKRFFRDFYTNAVVSNKYANGLIMVGDAQIVIRKDYTRVMLLNRGLGFDTDLFGLAQALILNPEYAKTVAEFRTKNKTLFNLEYEKAKLTDSLTHFVEVFGAENLTVVNLMHQFGSGPADIAAKLVRGTKLFDMAEYKKLAEGGIEAINASTDPMLLFAKFVKEDGEKYRSAYNKAVEEEQKGYAQLSDAIFQGYGAIGYPDATFTLRLSFGTVVGDSQYGIQPFTTIGGLYRHSVEFGNSGDYKLPSKWWTRKKTVRMSTPLNFVSNLDITGGNSGSPVINRNMEIVGIVFDSNVEGLVSDYDYNYTARSRAVAVDSRGITEILSKIYRAHRLVVELTR